jgi:SEL1 protein
VSYQGKEIQTKPNPFFVEDGQYEKATGLFEVAVRNGSPFEAYYYLGIMHAAQVNNAALPDHVRQGACAAAVSSLKIVAERGCWEDNFVQEAEEAWASGTEHGKDLALIKWAIAAERGYEVAQNNLAFVLDQGLSIFLLVASPN